MSDAELISLSVERYRNLVKIENAPDREAEIRAQLKTLEAKLEMLGIVVGDLKME